ncbi:MAG: DUF4339 domain-containing protein [Bacteroidetes bacterium]|nr:DUF4339 domain-containing protein [Bacteroidota bacterium]
MNYYYLKGIEKIGPLTIDELKQSSLSDDTLIWYENLKEWTKLSNLPELKNEILGGAVAFPPPIPQEIVKKENEIQNDIKTKSNTILIIILVIISFIIIGLSLYFAYTSANKQIEKDYTLIERMVNNIFQDKSAVCDGVFYNISGNKKKVTFNKIKIDGKECITNSELFKYGADQVSKIVEEFIITDGGFIVYKITKEDKGFVIKKSVAGNMIYKVGEYENFNGYRMPSYRPSISSCYSKAYSYLTEKQKDGSYIPNIYNQIQNFDRIKSEFYLISNETNPRMGGSHWWQENDGFIYEQFAVYFKNDFWYYEIKPNDIEISKKYSNIVAYGFIIGLSIVVLLNVIIYFVRKFN